MKSLIRLVLFQQLNKTEVLLKRMFWLCFTKSTKASAVVFSLASMIERALSVVKIASSEALLFACRNSLSLSESELVHIRNIEE